MDENEPPAPIRPTSAMEVLSLFRVDLITNAEARKFLGLHPLLPPTREQAPGSSAIEYLSVNDVEPAHMTFEQLKAEVLMLRRRLT